MSPKAQILRFRARSALKAADRQVAAGQPQAGLERLERLLTKFAGLEPALRAEALERAAGLARQLGRPQDARRHLEGLTRSRPEDLTAWRRLATTLDELKADSDALAAWTQVFKRAHDDLGARRRLADLLQRAGRLDKALPHVVALAEAEPHDAARWRRVAELHDRLGQPAQAADAWDRALQEAPSDLAARERLADLRLALGQPSAAAPHLAVLAEARPTKVKGWRRLARTLEDAGAIEQAAAAWERGLQADPTWEEAYEEVLRLSGPGELRAAAARRLRPLARTGGKLRTWRLVASALAEAGAAAEAIDIWRDALEAQPGLAEAHEAVVQLLLAQGRKAETVPHLQALAESAPASPKPWRRLAQLLAELGEPQAEINAWKRLLDGLPDDGSAHARLADLFWNLDDKVSAIPHLEQTVARWPDQTKAWRRLAIAALETGGPPEREIRAWRGMLTTAEDDQAHVRLAGLLWDLDRKAEAVEHLRVTTTRDQRRIKDWKRLGICLAVAHETDEDMRRALGRTGQFYDQIAVWRQVLEIDPKDREAHRELAGLLWDANRKSEAAPYLEALVAAAPRDAKAWRRLATAHEETGQADDEIRAWRGLLAVSPGEARALQRLAVLEADAGSASPQPAARRRRPSAEASQAGG